MATKYRNLGGDSSVEAYEIGPDFIWIYFPDSKYQYTNARTGRQHVEEMKRLAKSGRGLNTYIRKNVYSAYARILPRT